MGNIFPLSEKPSCFEDTLKLIEKSFHYQAEHQYKIDFAPLLDQSNHENCFIYLDENENLIGHIGTKSKILNINEKKYNITLLGGIAVDESRRGEGIFQSLFQYVLAEKRSDTCFFLLWSDLEKLYKKFGFYLCGTQFEISKDKSNHSFIKTKYAYLSLLEKDTIKSLYKNSFCGMYLSLERTDKDWDLIEKISSAELFIRKINGQIEDYFFKGKGQDLQDVIYEYGTTKDIGHLINEIASFGKVWTGKETSSSQNIQYQFFLGPGDLRLFSDFIYQFTNQKFTIRNINVMKQEVFFDFNGETLVLEMSDFLRGVFGPGTFEELSTPTFFISGLDSI